MKKLFLVAASVASLSACTEIYVPRFDRVPLNQPATTAPATIIVQPVVQPRVLTPVNEGFRLAPSHWSDVAKIRNEADRLSVGVAQGGITKVQAAQMLNRFRIQTVGRNSIDDNMYEVYLRAVVESQSGQITPSQSKAYIQNALEGWQRRWPNMGAERPVNPAFTNFLIEYMKMRPLM